MEEYARAFEHLLMKCDLVEDDEQTFVRFLGGFNYKIAHVVELQTYTTLEGVIHLACKVEKQQKSGGGF